MDKEDVKGFYETFEFERMINQEAPKPITDFLEGEVEFIAEHIKSNSSILEIGCGYGRLLKILSKKAEELVGIDFSTKMVKLSKENFSDEENVSVKLMEADNLSFQDETFDYVVCLDSSLGNMPNIEGGVLKEMERVCKRGGEVIISVFSENARDVQKENYERIGLTNIEDDGNAIQTSEGFYSKRFTRKELKSLFENTGLHCEIRKLCPVNYVAYATKGL